MKRKIPALLGVVYKLQLLGWWYLGMGVLSFQVRKIYVDTEYRYIGYDNSIIVMKS